MKKILTGLLVGMTVILIGGGCVSRNTDCDVAARLNALEKEITDLQREDMNKIGIRELFENYIVNGRIDSSLIFRYLKLNALPPNPNEEQVKDYLTKMVLLQNYLYNDLYRLEVSLQLKKIGREFLPVMIPLLSRSQALQQAAGAMITKDDKPLLAEYLKDPNSYQVIEIYKKLADASDGEMVAENLPLNPMLINLAAQSNIPKDKILPVVTKKLLESDNRFNYYEQWLDYALKNLDETPSHEFLTKYWRKTAKMRKNIDSGAAQAAIQMLPYGFVPAFEFLVENISWFGNDNYRLNLLLASSPCKKVSELKEWYRQNKGKEIIFDDINGIYNIRPKPSEKADQ